MKNNEVIRIAIAETSVIIRGGLTAALKRLPNAKVQPIELLSAAALHRTCGSVYAANHIDPSAAYEDVY